MSLTKQRDFLVLLSAYVNQSDSSRETVLNYIYKKGWIILSEEELSRRTKDDAKYIWKVYLAYARKRLVDEGCILGGTWNTWSITNKGITQLALKFENVKSNPTIITEKLINDAEQIISGLILLPTKINRVSNSNAQRKCDIAMPIILTKTEKEVVVKQRIGQGLFRKQLLQRSQTCQICGLAHESLLRASHIKPWNVSNNEEKLDVNNGLLLCVLHDGLFDKGLISFSSTGNILISKLLTLKERKILHLNHTLIITGANAANKYFQYHREYVFKN